jgi:hypothetical protein
VTSPDAPTERIRRLTRPLEELPPGDPVPVAGVPLRWRVQEIETHCAVHCPGCCECSPPRASCARCGGSIEALSQGHYQDGCLVVMRQAPFHFCCPVPPGCELQEPREGAPPGARRG